MERVTAELTNYLIQLPVILVGLAGIVLSLVFWRCHPMVSILTIISIVVLLMEMLISA